jgi:hypothetical protein
MLSAVPLHDAVYIEFIVFFIPAWAVNYAF